MADDIPLTILVLDPDASTARTLDHQLAADQLVTRVVSSDNLTGAQTELRSGDFNAIFVDPLSLDLHHASKFIFSVRTALPEIVFVIYVDYQQVHSRSDFYAGERARFSHYYHLDKRTPVGAFADEVQAVVTLCIQYLSWNLSAESLKRLRDTVKADSQRPDSVISPSMASEIDRVVSRVTHVPRLTTEKRTVFLSHRFADTDYVEGLTRYLADQGFALTVAVSTNTYVSRAVLQRISDADYFLCLMTRDKEKADGTYTTSPWLLEEKGAALALGKPIVLMVENGVDDFGGLQGDWQRIHFTPKEFLKAAMTAVDQLKSYG